MIGIYRIRRDLLSVFDERVIVVLVPEAHLEALVHLAHAFVHVLDPFSNQDVSVDPKKPTQQRLCCHGNSLKLSFDVVSSVVPFKKLTRNWQNMRRYSMTTNGGGTIVFCENSLTPSYR